MKLRVVLTLLVLLTLVMTIHVYAYSASATCSRGSHTYASASISSSGLKNGTYNVYAKVNYGSSNAGTFKSNTVSSSVSDMGSTSQSGTANAYVGGYNSSGNYQSDTASCSIP